MEQTQQQNEQPQQGPQQQQQQQQVVAAQGKKPPPYISSKRYWITKLVMRIISSICDLVLIGVAARTAYIGPILFTIPAATVALIWNISEGVCILVRGGHRGIHPGAIVAIDLILWLAFAVCASMFGAFGWLDSYSYYDYYYDYSSAFSSARTLVGFAAVEVLLHLALFIIGCIECSMRNRQTGQVVYYTVPMGMPMQPGPYPQPVYMSPQGYQGFQGQPMYQQQQWASGQSYQPEGVKTMTTDHQQQMQQPNPVYHPTSPVSHGH